MCKQVKRTVKSSLTQPWDQRSYITYMPSEAEQKLECNKKFAFDLFVYN